MICDEEFTPVGKGATVLLLVLLGLAAATNIFRGDVPHPNAFAVVLFGFGLFLVAKLSVVGWKKWISVGPGLMSSGMADLYRVGYWFMMVGILLTFVP